MRHITSLITCLLLGITALGCGPEKECDPEKDDSYCKNDTTVVYCAAVNHSDDSPIRWTEIDCSRNGISICTTYVNTFGDEPRIVTGCIAPESLSTDHPRYEPPDGPRPECLRGYDDNYCKDDSTLVKCTRNAAEDDSPVKWTEFECRLDKICATYPNPDGSNPSVVTRCVAPQDLPPDHPRYEKTVAGPDM